MSGCSKYNGASYRSRDLHRLPGHLAPLRHARMRNTMYPRVGRDSSGFASATVLKDGSLSVMACLVADIKQRHAVRPLGINVLVVPHAMLFDLNSRKP